MSELAFRSVYDVERRWSAESTDMQDTRRRLSDVDLVGLPRAAQAVARIFCDAWSGYADESAGLADGFLLALSACSYTFHATDGYVADELLHLDGRLGPAR